MQRKPCRQRGAILVMTVLFLVVLLGFSALALDFGRLYVLRTEMQNAADAAALAAAAELDGRENAISDAVLAAKNLLAHTGRFSNYPELLTALKYDIDPSNSSQLLDPDLNRENAFEFYRTISAELDTASAVCNDEHPLIYDDATSSWIDDDRKCLASGDHDAFYVKVKLDPELVIKTGDEEFYQITLYLAPILGILAEGELYTASTKVTAVAGAGGPVYCKYPPLFMCAVQEENPPENPEDYDPSIHYPGIGIGEEMLIRPQSGSSSWGPGNVGYLDVGEDIEIPLDAGGTRLEKNKSAMAAALGNEFLRRTCDPAIVSTLTGIDQNKTRKAFNTRFGLYDGNDGFDNAKNALPPAPNTIDYPDDDVFTPASSIYDSSTRWGTGWTGYDSDCLRPSSGCDAKMTHDENLYSWPETFNRDDYILYNHLGGDTTAPDFTPPVGSESMPDISRYSLYQWELSSGNTPNLTNVPDIATPDQENCTAADGGKKYCWLHNGAPPVDQGTAGVGDPERRILRLAVIKCSKYGINGVTPDINLNPEVTGDPFPFHKFFLTKHAQNPSDTEMFAEYVGPVEAEEEIQEIKHTVIQLYD